MVWKGQPARHRNSAKLSHKKSKKLMAKSGYIKIPMDLQYRLEQLEKETAMIKDMLKIISEDLKVKHKAIDLIAKTVFKGGNNK